MIRCTRLAGIAGVLAGATIIAVPPTGAANPAPMQTAHSTVIFHCPGGDFAKCRDHHKSIGYCNRICNPR